jgi:nucleoside-diphosphate-sugar epimerase
VKLLVTGAGGFLGRHVVAAAAARGHQVRAMVRPAARKSPSSWEGLRGIEVVRADLRDRRVDRALFDGIDVVIHLAASKSGDLYEQLGGTVLATENLLGAMREAGLSKIVLTSSFSVYEYLRRWSWGVLDESSPLAVVPEERDEYCQTKLLQERLVREAAEGGGWRCVVLRPGVVFGRDNLWSARIGMQAGRWWIRTGAFARLPLTYVENCAEAVVLAAEHDGAERLLTLNVVDDVTPSQRSYVRAPRRRMPVRPRVLPVPWLAMRGAARLAWLVDRILFGGTAKVPGILVPARLHARCKPLRYPNARIREALRWTPRFGWREGIERSLAEEERSAKSPAPAAPVQRPLPASAGERR